MTENMHWAVVTPSYNLDIERCSLLCRSMDAFLQGAWHHYIVVDPVDLPLFAPLARPQRSIINKADILPKGMRYLGKVPLMRLGRLWWSRRHGLIFGWQMQQFVKILMASHIEENAMMFCDSDVFFLKPFNLSNLSRGNKIRFGSVESQPNPDDKMIIPSIELLGIKQSEVRRLILGDQIVVWHRSTVIAMQEYLTTRHGRLWHEAIGSKLMFSEYQLYALFVNYIQKKNEYLYEDATVYCKGLWTKADAKSIDLAKFCSELAPHEVAVCIQSLIGVDVNLLKTQFELALSE